jgi:bacteriocin-like protein
VPAGANVVIVRSLGGEPDLEEQVALWEEGATTGEYRLHVPAAPQVETKELSESDLAAVSGGGNVTACCCCCPCCTCT